MKILLILMIFLSLFVGISINGVWSSLYNFEFPSVINMIKAETFTNVKIIEWTLLLATHLVIVSLPFLIKKKYFRDLLIIAPALFVLLYFIVGGAMGLFLIPFIIVWTIAVFQNGKIQKT
jgi:hypothetical protein